MGTAFRLPSRASSAKYENRDFRPARRRICRRVTDEKGVGFGVVLNLGASRFPATANGKPLKRWAVPYSF